MTKENFFIGAAFAGLIVVVASAVLFSAWLFLLGFGLMMCGVSLA